jgi:gliding motility-associated lipoprotein GldH
LIRFLVIGFLFLVTLGSCDKGVLVSEQWEWKDKQWIHGDRKAMILEGVDTSSVYEMDIRLDHEQTYDFQNLYIKTWTTFPSGKEVTSVTSIELIREDGSWAGDCRGNVCSIEMPLQMRFTFPEIGKYTWGVEPYMRMDTVEGIKSFRVTVKKVKD